ncbi:MAG: short-chain dehydrogenase [Chitinophagaceae bacterium]|nr:short-chain dehydrogenase [Chitinophagaceae bacterium]
MTNDQIEKVMETHLDKSTLNIFFKTRSTIKGVFIKTSDYTELKTKNLWRIVSESKLKEYQTTKDTSLARIFNGTEITRLGAA